MAICGLQDIVDDQLVMALMDGHHAQPLPPRQATETGVGMPDQTRILHKFQDIRLESKNALFGSIEILDEMSLVAE